MPITEILLTKLQYVDEDWFNLISVLSIKSGGIQPFTINVVFSNNKLRILICSKKDISSLSNGLNGFMFMPVGTNIDIPQSLKSNNTWHLYIPTGSNIFDIRDYYRIKKNINIVNLRFRIWRILDSYITLMTAVVDSGNGYTSINQVLMSFPCYIFKFDLEQSQNYIFSSTPDYLNLEKTIHLLDTNKNNAIFSVPAFPYYNGNYFLSLKSYSFDKHSLIVGSSGSGKSRLIQLIVDRISKYSNSIEQYRIIVIDPHYSLGKDLININGSRIVNLSIESAQLFPDSNVDISAATELTTTLFKSLLSDQFNSKLERVVRFSIYVLLAAQIMTLENMKQFLTDLEMRTTVLSHVNDFVPHNIIHFFAVDFIELRTQYYNESIVPIVALVDEMQMHPSLSGEAKQSLVNLLMENFLTVFSLSKISMGEKAVKIAAGLLIQQIFLIAQSRTFPYKLILIVDEVSVVQNEAMAAILSEARKFNLSLYLTQQYFSQVDNYIKDSILSNTINYYIFRVSEDDAKQLESNVVIELSKEKVQDAANNKQSSKDIKIKMMTELSPRECLVRLSSDGQLMPVIKSRTVGINLSKSDEYFDHNQSYRAIKKLQKLPSKLILNEDVNISETLSNLSDNSSMKEAWAETANNDLAVLIESKKTHTANIQQLLANQSLSK